MEIEVGENRFSENLRWLLCEWGGKKGELGRKAFDTRLTEENGRKRICRLMNKTVSLKVRDADAIAGVLEIPTVVLVYGTKNQLKKSWEQRWKK